MKRVGYTIFLVFFLYGIEGLKSGLTIRYGPLKLSVDHLPQNVSAARDKAWVLAAPAPQSPFPNLKLYCYPDYTVCNWFNGDVVAGLQIAFAVAQLEKAALDFGANGYYRWEVNTGGTTEVFYVTSQYFYSPDVLLNGASFELADQSIPANGILKQGRVWVQGFNSQLISIPTTTKEIAQENFTREGCQIFKGFHYLYNLSRTGPDCSAETLLHWFPIVKDGQLTATGLFLLAKVNPVPGQRDWFERPPSIGLRILIPRAPDCLYQLADDYTVTSTHIYYVDNPLSILCPLILL